MKLLILILSFFAIELFANDILTNYRNNGITDIEKQMDLELSKEEYWNGILEQRDTKFGYIESYENILACDKSASKLEFYKLDEKNNFILKNTHSAYVGKANGDKLKAGDLKTPVGIYNLVQKLSKDTKLDPFYGPYAFVTSYPNLYDTYRGKNGSGIWIHGLPEQSSRDEFTKGCIAINNKNIECLNKNINLDKTILIIEDNKPSKNISKKTLTMLLSELYAWRYAWIYDDINGYLSRYDSEFVRDDGMNYEQFKSYKQRVFSKNERKSIVFTNINVFAYPGTENLYQITFKESYRSDSFKFAGDKILIVKSDDKNRFKIITEK